MARPKSSNGKSVNKSQAIRDLLTADPKAKTSEVVSKLAEQGIKVTNSLVYMIKSKQSHKRKRLKRELAVETSRQIGSSNPVSLVMRVKELAREVGGYKTLKQLVDVLAE